MKLRTVFWWGLPVLLLAALGTGGVWLWSENAPADGSAPQQFRIPAGETLTATAARLAERGLVRNPLVFRAAVQFGLGDKAVPSGTFAVPGGMTAVEAAEYFRHAKPIQIRVTVPEGWTSTKIARLLEEKHVASAKEFLRVVQNPSVLGPAAEGLSTLDGRLFPETYLFPLDTPAEDVARTFLTTFQDRTKSWNTLYPAEEVNRRLILASIVEREYRAAEEAPLIASVFANRLEQRIPLGSCATIEYILTEIQGRPHPKRIFFVHTEIPSPYNTYLNKGLPPGPISNPGLTALKAAFEPAATNYLYFVVKDAATGTHTFSSNFSGHQKAREAYLNTFVTKG